MLREGCVGVAVFNGNQARFLGRGAEPVNPLFLIACLILAATGLDFSCILLPLAIEGNVFSCAADLFKVCK
jgi:hypothetical protein